MSSKNPKQFIDEYLDDEADRPTRSRSRKVKNKRKSIEKSLDTLAPEEANATVAEVFRKLCRVRLDQDPDRELLCPYRRADVFRRSEDGTRERSPVAVGDRVRVRVYGSKDGVVEGVCDRKNQFVRPAPGKEENMVHVLAANVDELLIIASVHEPEFSAGLVDRFLIAAQKGKVHPILVINKSDLLATGEQPWRFYPEKLGLECIVVSARAGVGIDELKERIQGSTAVFCGFSGVGKTSLIQSLLGVDSKAFSGKVGALNAATKKGRHTTTSAVLLNGPANSRWIDTPGVRSFGIHGIQPEELVNFFPEFQALTEYERASLHVNPMEVQAAHRFERFDSYCRILESIVEELPCED